MKDDVCRILFHFYDIAFYFLLTLFIIVALDFINHLTQYYRLIINNLEAEDVVTGKHVFAFYLGVHQ